MTLSDQHQILDNFARSGCIQNPRLLTTDELERFTRHKMNAAVEGTVLIEGQEVVLCVGVDERFPEALPIVFLCSPNALGIIPHVEESGYICYLDSEGLLLDVECPGGILQEAVALSIDRLRKGLRGENHQDFMDEFSAYWQQLNLEMPILPAFILANQEVRKIFAYKRGKNYLILADNIKTVQAYFNNQKTSLNSLTRHTALYVPLQEGTLVLPPQPNQLWRNYDVREIVRKNIKAENWQKIQRLGGKRKSEELVLLGLPRPKGGMTLVGLLFSGVSNGRHPLLSGSSQEVPLPISIQRHDLDYLLPRGGGQSELTRFRVLVAGCGSVGGYIALMLVQAGITNLLLVDPDIFKLENIYRHILGKEYVGRPKVTALKAELEKKYPYLSITTHQVRIEQAVREGLIDLADFDLVIFATGNHTIELSMNRLLHQMEKKPTSVFAWLEPYGIGGHSLLIHPSKPGCLQCLFTSPSDPETPLRNRSAFAAYDQSFSKNDLGCGSTYTPFSALDAHRTAEQTVRLGLDGLTLVEQRNPIISWKGTSHQLTSVGFCLSPRYQLAEECLYEGRYDYINVECSICGVHCR